MKTVAILSILILLAASGDAQHDDYYGYYDDYYDYYDDYYGDYYDDYGDYYDYHGDYDYYGNENGDNGYDSNNDNNGNDTDYSVGDDYYNANGPDEGDETYDQPDNVKDDESDEIYDHPSDFDGDVKDDEGDQTYDHPSDFYGDVKDDESDDNYDHLSDFESGVKNDGPAPIIETVKFTDCGGEITELPSSILRTPGYPSESDPGGVYPTDAYCQWWFDGDEKTLVRFKMWSLAMQLGKGDSNKTCDFDYINVTITSIGSRRFCGHSAPDEEMRGKGSFLLTFVSDSEKSYRGMQGTYQITEDFDPCDPSPCTSHGTCEVLPDLMSVRCICEDGFTGQRCEIDIPECDSNPCLNGGTCNDKIKPNYYECTCELGWEGVNCEIKIMNPCIPDPCQNGGTCRNHSETTFSCNCTEHYTGKNCENENFPPCFSYPCKNNGSCVDLTAGVKTYLVPAPEGSDEEYVEMKAPPEYLGFNCTCDLTRFRGELCEIAAGCSNPGIVDLDARYWFEPNFTVQFSCIEDYILVGFENTTCFADGTWSRPLPECVVNVTAAAMKQEEPISPWLGLMMALGGAFAITVAALASWMIVKGPWRKVNRIISISRVSLNCEDDTGGSSYDNDGYSDDATSSASGSYTSSNSSLKDMP